MWGQNGWEADPSPRSDRVSGKLSISLPRVLTTGMTPRLFQGGFFRAVFSGQRFRGAQIANRKNSRSFLQLGIASRLGEFLTKNLGKTRTTLLGRYLDATWQPGQ